MVGPPPPPRQFRRQPFDPVDWAARNPKKVAGLLVLALFLGWFLLKGPFYTVQPDEQGLVLTFGKHSATTGPGFHLKWPWPIQTVLTPKVKEVKQISLIEDGASRGRRSLDEAEMLTGDENIVTLDLVVQYQIKDAAAFLFNVREPEEALRDITRAAIRQVVGDHLIDEVLTEGKTEIQLEVRDIVQELADFYGLGLTILQVNLQDVAPPREVEQAFKEVATAREDRSRLVNEALAYQNKLVPEAEGQAEKILRKAEATRAARIAIAEGEADRFTKLATEYAKAPDVTRERLLLETLEKVLPGVEKIVVDESAGVLHLNRLDLGGDR